MGVPAEFISHRVGETASTGPWLSAAWVRLQLLNLRVLFGERFPDFLILALVLVSLEAHCLGVLGGPAGFVLGDSASGVSVSRQSSAMGVSFSFGLLNSMASLSPNLAPAWKTRLNLPGFTLGKNRTIPSSIISPAEESLCSPLILIVS